MKKQNIILFSVLAAVIVIAVVIFFVMYKGTGKTETGTTTAAAVPDIDPAVASLTDGETGPVYDSFEAAFTSAVQAKINILVAKNQNKPADELFTGAWATNEGTPTVILGYISDFGTPVYNVYKFKDGVLYERTIETGFSAFDDNNNIYFVDGSDILVLRSAADTDDAKQIIYDFFDDNYIPVRENSYGAADTEQMDATLEEYTGTAKELSPLSDVIVTGNITSYLSQTLGITLTATP